jgi:EAL domain-containing protein (putative c-di-GMP-specific phosphodiesterase class I)
MRGPRSQLSSSRAPAVQGAGANGRSDDVAVFRRPAPESNPATSPPVVGLPGVPHLVFQPAVEMATGRLLGFEALLRWANGVGGSIPPEILIPWAEDRGQMTALNAWVLAEACAQAVRWPADVQLAVNCSVFQLRRGEAAIAAAAALEGSGLDANSLTIEVTEDSVTDLQATADLRALHRLGIKLALDDVGPDWSILNKLPECVVNTVKIDTVLIADLAPSGGASRPIVEAIVKLSKSLGLATVAEAVESGEQAAVLLELGVDIAQGFFFSPPVSAKDACALAARTPLPTFPLADHADPVSTTAVDPPKPPYSVRAVPDPATVAGPTTSLPPIREVRGQPIPSSPPASAHPAAVHATPDRSAAPAPRRPLAPVDPVPDQVPLAVAARSLHTEGPVPDQAPVPITRKPLAPHQAHVPVSGTESGGARSGQDVQFDQLNHGIARLVAAVERLNELLEPVLEGQRITGRSTRSTG